MRTAFGFLCGVVFTVAFFAGAIYVGVHTGVLWPGADRPPPWLEQTAARNSIRVSLERETPALVDPLQPDEANLVAGIKLYAANCAICHGAADGAPSAIARGFYVRARQFAQDGVEEDDEADSFWKIDHGIRYTAMPAFAKSLSSDDEWRLAIFLRRMDALPPSVERVWKAVPSERKPA